MIKIRANALRPGDVILVETYGKMRFRVETVKRQHDTRPRKVVLSLSNGSERVEVTVPWDRRHLVERNTTPSVASEAQESTLASTAPAEPIPGPSERFAALLAEAREEFIAKIRKIIRENP